MYCRKCGTQLQEDSRFCGKCGENQYQSVGAPVRSRTVAGFLALLLGWGTHNLYLGHIKHGVVQLCLWVVSSIGVLAASLGESTVAVIVFGIIGILVGIWETIEGIRIFAGKEKDGNGNPLV